MDLRVSLKGVWMDFDATGSPKEAGTKLHLPLPPPPLGRTEPMATLKLIIYCWLVFAGTGLLRFSITVDDNR